MFNRATCSKVLLLGAIGMFCESLLAQTTATGFTAGSLRVTETGAAEYRVPLRLPPGTSGMAPALALTYNSQGGNGLTGTGWQLEGLSSIYRCGRTFLQDGAFTGVRFDANDRFCLDGQRLVAVSGTYGADQTQYRTERESFTKVVSYGTAGNGPAYFKAWTKSGQILEYGNTADSRIEAQGKSSARAWALNKALDSKGNYFTITYAEDNANGHFNPTRIDYTGNAGASVTPFASVQFAYETRTDNSAVYVGGSLVKMMNRIANVKTYVGTTLVTDYRLAYTYAPNSGPSLLNSITECDGAGVCLSPTALGWTTSNATLSVGGAESWSGWTYGGGANARDLKAADVNGDGMADVVWVEQIGSVWYYVARFSTGSGFGGPVILSGADYSYYMDPDYGWYMYTITPFALADANGDGKADIVTIGPGAGEGNVRLSTGTGVAGASSWGGLGSSWSFRVVGDFNGDGKADLAAIYAPNASIYLLASTGSGFGGAVYQAPAAYDWNEFGMAFRPIFAGDVNGDGVADLVSSAGDVWSGSSAGLSSAGVWPGTLGATNFGDVNGDGMADAVTAYGSSYAAGVSNGGAFGYAALGAVDGTYDPETGYLVPLSYAVGDVTGDGKADIITYAGGGSLLVHRAQTPAPSLVTAITNGLGLTATIAYKALNDGSVPVYTKDSDAVWPVRDLKNEGPLYVAYTTSVPSLVSGGNYTTTYKYTGAKAHLRGGGFLGFRQFESGEDATGIKSVNTFRQSHPYRGLPLTVERKQSSGTLIAKTTNSWTDNPAVNSFGYGFTTGVYHRSDLTQVLEEAYELTGSLTTSATTANQFDEYGNATSVVVTSTGGFSKSTVNSFTNDTTNWFLGRLTRSVVTSTTP